MITFSPLVNQITVIFLLGLLFLLDSHTHPLVLEWFTNIFSYSVGCLYSLLYLLLYRN